ncbi:MAG: type II toxin-antitoxin system RelE/ParE family toxin [Bacteroidales bacterium]
MVKKKKLAILWDEKAKESLDKIYEYVAMDSVEAARYVKRELIRLAGSLNDFPEKYPKEACLKDEPEDYRFATKWSYKIIFEITNESIIIAAIFHTSQHPAKIKRIKKE